MDYQLTQTGEQTQNLLNEVPVLRNDLDAEVLRSTNKDDDLETAIGNEKTRAEGAEGELQTAIGNEKTRAEGAELVLRGDIADNGTAIGNEKTRAEGAEGTLQQNIDAEALARQQADGTLQGGIDAIDAKIPAQASAQNQLADKNFVNSSIATNTADFKGTYNSLEQLEQVTANANDYGFVVTTDAAGNTVYKRYKYVDGTGWVFEYDLNNSSFTADQWAAINSAITAALVAKLADLPTAASLTQQLNDIIGSVTTEKNRAEGVETNLNTAIGNNTTAIGNEKTRAEAAEAVLRGSIADNATAIANEKTRAEGAEGLLQTAIGNEKTRAEGVELVLQQNIDAEALLRGNADDALQGGIDAINAKIPAAASSSNQLADKAFVNSSIATNTATFRGTYNSVAALDNVTADANDYAFVVATDAAGNTVYNRYKYVDGTGWVFEYALNNSSFTSDQWAAINSGITALLVTKLNGLPDIDGLNAMFSAITSLIPSAATSSNKLVDYAQMVAALATKQNTLTFDNTPTQNSQNPVTSGGIYTVIAALQSSKQDVLTFDNAPTAGSNNPVKSSGIKSAIDSASDALSARISTNAADIAALQALYNALQQSAPDVIEPTDTWPVANPSTTVIYRVIDRVNTPPEYYSDYMWNGTAFVLMATYNNAIDDVPTAGSNNLVKSGGVNQSIYYTTYITGVDCPYYRKGSNVQFTWVDGILKEDGTIAENSGYKTGSYYNNNNLPLYIKILYNFSYNVNIDFRTVAIFSQGGDFLASALANGDRIIVVPAYTTIKISIQATETIEDGKIFSVTPDLEKNYSKYFVPYYIYDKNGSIFNFYRDTTWKVDVSAKLIFILGCSGFFNLTASTVDSQVSGDVNSCLFLLIDITNSSVLLVDSSNIYYNYLCTGKYRILAYGNPLKKDNLCTFNSYKYNGKEIDYKKSYNMVEAFYYHENNLALTIEYGGANGIQVKNGAAFLKLVIDGNVTGWFNLSAGQKTATANSDSPISDLYGNYFYLVFDVVSKEFDVLTAGQLNQIVDSTYVIGHGRLGIDKFTSAFEIKINDTTIGGNNVVYSSQKKVLWIGTSIPAGSTYPVNSCKNNKRMCINKAIGASYIRLGSTVTPQTPPALDLSLSKTIAEYEAQYRPLVTQGLLTEATLNAWKNASYENVIMPYINDIDIIVFDHGYNDGSLINNEVTNPDWSSEDRTTFVGAFNYLMKKIFEVNPFIKIFISTYFQDKTEDHQASLQQIKNVVEMQKKISEHFGYPLLDSYKYCDFDGYFVPNTDDYMAAYNAAHGTQYVQYWSDTDGNMKRYQMYCIDGVHPYTDEAKEYLDKVYTHLLAGLI